MLWNTFTLTLGLTPDYSSFGETERNDNSEETERGSVAVDGEGVQTHWLRVYPYKSSKRHSEEQTSLIWEIGHFFKELTLESSQVL